MNEQETRPAERARNLIFGVVCSHLDDPDRPNPDDLTDDIVAVLERAGVTF